MSSTCLLRCANREILPNNSTEQLGSCRIDLAMRDGNRVLHDQPQTGMTACLATDELYFELFYTFILLPFLNMTKGET